MRGEYFDAIRSVAKYCSGLPTAVSGFAGETFATLSSLVYKQNAGVVTSSACDSLLIPSATVSDRQLYFQPEPAVDLGIVPLGWEDIGNYAEIVDPDGCVASWLEAEGGRQVLAGKLRNLSFMVGGTFQASSGNENLFYIGSSWLRLSSLPRESWPSPVSSG